MELSKESVRTLKDEIIRMRKKCHKSFDYIAQKLGCSVSTVKDALAKKGRKPYERTGMYSKTAPEPSIQPIEGKGRSLAEFRATYDKDLIVPSKIKSALKQLGNSWVYEQEFMKLADVSLSDLGNYRDNFPDNYVAIRRSNKRVWAGSIALAKQLKEIAL